MKLREMLSKAVRPRLHNTFAGLELSMPDDEEELPPEEQKLDKISGICVIITYEDSKGNSSQRLVTCKQLSVRGGKYYITAFCHHRQAPRSFLIDRIVDVFDANTGECLSPAQAFFAEFEPDQFARSGFSWGLSVGRRADLIALLNALVFLARCDAEFHPAERDSLEHALTSFWLRLEILGNPDFDDILAYADKLAPDGETFWIALHRFREDEALRDIFVANSNRLIQADGDIHERESFWSFEIADFFSAE